MQDLNVKNIQITVFNNLIEDIADFRITLLKQKRKEQSLTDCS